MIASAVDTLVGDGGRSRNGVLAPAPNARLAVSGATYQPGRLASVFVTISRLPQTSAMFAAR
jgi:hypothetical protein